MSTCQTTPPLPAAEHTFAQLWALSGAPELVGYEASLLAVLARIDLPAYHHLAAVDLDDTDAVLDAVEAIQRWRREIAAGNRSFAFGARRAGAARRHEAA